MNPPPFKNRWLVTGTLTTRSELHIGDGRSEALTTRGPTVGPTEPEPEVETVCVDHQGQSFIPASSLRGPLRATLRDTSKFGTFAFPDNPEGALWMNLLGTPDPNAKNAVGGKLCFHDALLNRENSQATAGLPYWDEVRRTAVATSVSLDRRRRVAADHLLYGKEYVPAGQSFELEISGENLTEKEIRALLALLETLNHEVGPTVGGLSSSGWGRLRWCLGKIHCFERQALTRWMNLPQATRGIGLEMIRKHGEDMTDQFGHARNDPQSCCTLRIDLTLKMTAPWIIGNPQQKDRRGSPPATSIQTPLLDHRRHPWVPAKSFRGSLRSQAERILRTLNTHTPSPQSLSIISDRGGIPEAIKAAGKLDPAARLFGAPGWKSPLTISALTIPENTTGTFLMSHAQEFVAIDRFTGGAADELKFSAELALPCLLAGSLTLDLERLQAIDTNATCLGLLALLLRDLAEGDLQLGAHSAIGCGACKIDQVKITELGQAGAPKDYESLADWFTQSEIVNRGLTHLRQSSENLQAQPDPANPITPSHA